MELLGDQKIQKNDSGGRKSEWWNNGCQDPAFAHSSFRGQTVLQRREPAGNGCQKHLGGPLGGSVVSRPEHQRDIV